MFSTRLSQKLTGLNSKNIFVLHSLSNHHINRFNVVNATWDQISFDHATTSKSNKFKEIYKY